MQMNPYLSFKGDCEAAFTFYAESLEGSLDDLEICARHNHRLVPRPVELVDERQQLLIEGRLLGRGKRAVCLEHRSVIGFEDVEPMLRRAIPENEMPLLGFDRHRLVLEQLLEADLRAPERR